LNLQLKQVRNLVELLRRRVRTLEESNSQLRTSYDRVATYVPVAPFLTGNSGNSIKSIDNFGSTYSNSNAFSDRFDVLEMDRYSDLHIISREIMDNVVQLEEVTSDIETALNDVEATEREFGRSNKQMQLGVTQVRMRPLSDITGRFPRVIREMSVQYGKQVELKINGGNTLIERTILEALNDPFLHLVRNAFDHGIESPDARQAQGKPATGRIEITASYRGNQTLITIQDDGGGINLDKVKAKALTLGISADDLAKVSRQEVLELIFEPGFSTAAQVTDLSGRGVGMDVVRSNLKEVNGTVSIATEQGKGTTFTIAVPISLSIIRILLVESHGMLMGFPTSVVEEMLLVSSSIQTQEADLVNQIESKPEFLDWEGFSVPVIPLNQHLKFARSHRLADSENVPVINEPVLLLVGKDDQPYAIQCDRYWGEQEVATRLIEGMAMPMGFSGCAILGGGRVVPLVDVEKLLELTLNPRSPYDPEQDSRLKISEQAKTILIIDDSINVRRFLAMTLEKYGYRVEQAKDGQEALEKLQDSSLANINAIVCDIEMPRLDGFGFLAQSQAVPKFKDIPVLMLTSRNSNKHRQLAMNLGATGYFSKPFKEVELLTTLDQLTSTSSPQLAYA
jgi:two-component system, chemotaxis family, sensor histidine kinase and response regulator PixL